MTLNRLCHVLLHKAGFIFIGSLAALIGLFFITFPSEAAGIVLIDPPQSTPPENGECLACHSQPGQVLNFTTGDTLSISIDEVHYQDSMHGKLSCAECHPGISMAAHPKAGPVALRLREYKYTYQDTCKGCHPNQYQDFSDGIHKILQNDQGTTPVCSDCHNPHAQNRVFRTENADISERLAIPKTCAQCHSQIYQQYEKSVHGAALINESNPDVPTCVDCHGVHKIGDPRSTGFRLSSIDTCSNCHTNALLMEKYGISTAVKQSYVADFHGTTVTLFEKQNPDEQINMPVCYDCHGIHNISRVDDPTHGLQIKQNLLTNCQRCHPTADLNFPDAWLSHYIPSTDRYPLVYYVNLVYNILIPTVLGGMVLYVISDIIRIQINRRKRVSTAVSSKEK